MEITLEIDTSNIGKLPGRWEKAKAQGLNESAQTLVRFLMQNSPVDHGLLKQWFIESMDEEQAVIKSPAEYAIYQDQGTAPYLIEMVTCSGKVQTTQSRQYTTQESKPNTSYNKALMNYHH